MGERDQWTLSAPDAAAMDAVLEEEGGGDPERKARVEGWLGALETAPVPEMRGDLAARTLAAIQADRMVLTPVGAAGRAKVGGEEIQAKGRGMWRRRLAEIGSMAVAAMLLLAVTIVGMGTIRRSQARMACAANLKLASVAFATYAGVSSGELPMIALPANHNWLYGNGETGAKNNAANLLPLVIGNYLPMAGLFCAGAGLPAEGGPGTSLKESKNELPAIGYSYRNLYGAERPKWDGLQGTIVLADKNPVFTVMSHAGTELKNSENHDGKGNYLVRADGSVSWETSPNVGPDHDNIWTLGGAAGKERMIVYKGTETPADAKDVFVCP